MIAPFTTLECELKSFVIQYGVKRIYLQSGNAGDAIISAATKHLLDNLDFDLTIDSNPDWHSCAVSEKGVIFSGGGILNSHYQEGWHFIENAKNKGLAVFVLPHTIDFKGQKDVFDSSDVLVLRDEVSFSLAQEKVSARCILAHDMAFYPEKEWWLHLISRNHKECKEFQKKWRIRGLGRKRYFLSFLSFNHYFRELHAFRNDIESKGGFHKSILNVDVSGAIGSSSQASWSENENIASVMLSFISRWSKVRTDRLHVAIACHLMGVECQMYSNNYWKNRAVFDNSIAEDRESTVRFIA